VTETEQEQGTELEPETEPEHEPDEEHEHDAETETEQAPPAGPSEADMEARISKAERATKRYVSQVSAALEEEATNLIECPLCLSFARGFLHLGDRGNVPEDVQKAVKLWFGEAQEVAYPPSPQHRVCVGCQGLGQVSTGSRVPKWETILCASCDGKGFTGPPSAAENGHVSTTLAQQIADTPIASGNPEDVDPTGEPRLLPDGRQNPNFGRWPQYKIEVPPWGITAGLLSETRA
jgi:hypothetical protein